MTCTGDFLLLLNGWLKLQFISCQLLTYSSVMRTVLQALSSLSLLRVCVPGAPHMQLPTAQAVGAVFVLFYCCGFGVTSVFAEESLDRNRGGFRGVRVRLLAACIVALARGKAARMQLYYWQKPFLKPLVILIAFQLMQAGEAEPEEQPKCEAWESCLMPSPGGQLRRCKPTLLC